MKDFWLSCGHHLLDRDAAGALVLTDEFLKAYLARPELAPPRDACLAERTLHAALLADPRRPVVAEEVARLADGDARANWRVMLGFRDRLLAQPTVEAAYLALVREGAGETPPLFLDQLVHAILRNALDGCTDALLLRAAELFFRTQRLAVHAGALIAADEETVAGLAPQPVSPLVAMLGLPAGHEAQLDVLSDDSAEAYWERSDRFDMALDLTAGRRGLAALGEVIARWITHLLAVEVEVVPMVSATDVDLLWYVGLDAEGTAVGDRLWRGEELAPAMRERIVGLYRLEFRNPEVVLEGARGAPVFLILAMTPERTLRLKPQNLLTGLPIRRPLSCSSLLPASLRAGAAAPEETGAGPVIKAAS
ncbi:MAG TPA: DUF6352 family protein [Xanthobacteraceae bacterium]|jgi:hypothetical protein